MHVEEQFTPKTWPEAPERASLEGKNKFLGFWFFLGGETVLFASLFATYLALKDKVPTNTDIVAKDIFGLPLAFLMTMVLLTSSITSVYAIYHMKNYHFKKMQAWLLITVLLGVTFLGLEIYEFVHYTKEGFGFTSSAFSSAFYTLVGFHGGHVVFGLSWIIALMVRNAKRGLSLYNAPKFYVASLYWHFIDVVWVFIFTVVYLMGMVG
ncbi:cytochrome (ubi)quinol oxidase subunit III [Bacillus sp. FSL K6-3431]|uniref:cytochrome (ubi)quinol oxidase subunit III n=1 Tax=Bacillus sp. FSL K6-3431 TaxID=2921500 RepID=UPI0030F8EE32